MTASARPAAECPQCGRRWDKLGPQGYECRRCGLVLSRDELAATVAHATRNGSEPVGSTQAEPEVYFVKGFAAKRMADRLREDTHFATGGGRLYAYSQGCYRLGGEDHVRSRVAEALGDRWTKRYADEARARTRRRNLEPNKASPARV